MQQSAVIPYYLSLQMKITINLNSFKEENAWKNEQINSNIIFPFSSQQKKAKNQYIDVQKKTKNTAWFKYKNQ